MEVWDEHTTDGVFIWQLPLFENHTIQFSDVFPFLTQTSTDLHGISPNFQKFVTKTFGFNIVFEAVINFELSTLFLLALAMGSHLTTVSVLSPVNEDNKILEFL